MATALELGLVPGFALQDGDRLAELIGGSGPGGAGGGFGLGNTASGNTDLTNSSNNSATGAMQIVSSVTVVMTATATGNSLQLVPIPVSTALRIYNETGQMIYIFPPTGMSADISQGIAAPINDGLDLTGGMRCDYLYLGNNQWITDLLGSSSE